MDCEELAYSGSEGSKCRNDSGRRVFWQLVPPALRGRVTNRTGSATLEKKAKKKAKCGGMTKSSSDRSGTTHDPALVLSEIIMALGIPTSRVPCVLTLTSAV